MTRRVPKDEARKQLEVLPDEDIQQKIDHGIAASDRGDFISDDEIEQRITRWAGE